MLFSDASKRAFGAIAYLQFELCDGGVRIVFVIAQSKVTAEKYKSMPRLELCRCLKVKPIGEGVRKDLRIKIRCVLLLTDSTTNLRWFNSKECFHALRRKSSGRNTLNLRRITLALRPHLIESSGRHEPRNSAEELTIYHHFFTKPAILRYPLDS